jgi:hypothetical protein
MNRRATRAREFYGYALIAGISITEARHMMPGWIVDMYKIRVDYDARISGGRGILKGLAGGKKKRS